VNPNFWRGKKIMITGHTGFKGAWLSLWLSSLGARAIGYSLDPPTHPSLFESANVQDEMESVIGDIRDYELLKKTIERHEPEIVFHMAAQSLVLRGYQTPVDTFDVNVLGTAKVLEVARRVGSVKVLVVVTTDKCYQVGKNSAAFIETDVLGGNDPYSSSKACAELVVAAYRSSYSGTNGLQVPLLATARAGNVIGGGDWAADRLLPDMVRAVMEKRPVTIRNPHSIRPWQHVLEPLGGYLLLAEKLWQDGRRFAEAWNFGPIGDAAPVAEVVERVIQLWGDGASWVQDVNHFPHETRVLKLDCSKAVERLGWKPRWNLSQALEATVDWYKAYVQGWDVRKIISDQVESYQDAGVETESSSGLRFRTSKF
jgi:CDP-glucose 4,6-dehydratase